jgi:hypothetical protein
MEFSAFVAIVKLPFGDEFNEGWLSRLQAADKRVSVSQAVFTMYPDIFVGIDSLKPQFSGVGTNIQIAAFPIPLRHLRHAEFGFLG